MKILRDLYEFPRQKGILQFKKKSLQLKIINENYFGYSSYNDYAVRNNL